MDWFLWLLRLFVVASCVFAAVLILRLRARIMRERRRPLNIPPPINGRKVWRM